MILALLLGILVGSYALLALFARGLEPLLRGRISLALLFAFTGVGHFVKTEPMVQMLPEWVPLRTELVVATGVLELLGALGLLVPATSRAAGLCLLASSSSCSPPTCTPRGTRSRWADTRRGSSTCGSADRCKCS